MDNQGPFAAGGGQEINFRPESLEETQQKMRDAILAYQVTEPEIQGSGHFVSEVYELQCIAKDLYDQTQTLLQSSAELMKELQIAIVTADQDAACKIERK